MKEIIGFIKAYYKEVNKPILFICTFFIAVLIWLNYQYHLEQRVVNELGLPFPDITGHFLIYMVAFFIPYLLLRWKGEIKNRPTNSFIICLLLAPLIFAIKVGINTNVDLSGSSRWNSYWNDIIYWPLRLVILIMLLAVCNFFLHKNKNLYGLQSGKVNFTPYFIMLLIMMPLIAAASTQPDFLEAYPKMKIILPLVADANPEWLYKLLFELSYGSDFFSIEIFFRGFLVIGFMKWVGKDAILPMACFYCTIHFGKPLGECISSFFGGMLLGIVSYHTKSIFGGLIVHLGIAWLMEVGGYIGNLMK